MLVQGGTKMITPIADFTPGPILLFVFLYGIAALVFVILVEAFALWVLRWGSYPRALRD